LEENDLISPRQFEGERVQQRFDPVSPKNISTSAAETAVKLSNFQTQPSTKSIPGSRNSMAPR
jgi:hypothetical protein